MQGDGDHLSGLRERFQCAGKDVPLCQFGDKPDDVNPYAASSFYAVDRYASYKTKWGSFYEAGGIVIADRYTTSNAVHQCSKLPPEQWDDFLRWAFDYEYRLLGLPAPDAVVYLQVDPAVSQKLMTGRYHGDESRKDVHEKDIEYLARSRRAAEYCAEHLAGPPSIARKMDHAHHRGYSGRGAGAGGKRTRITAKMGGILSMYRLMQPSDEAAVVALWQKERGDSAEFIKTALEKFAGAENIYVAEENDEIVAAALAVPVTLKGRSGSYLYGLCGQGSLLLAGLVDYLCAQQKLRGAGFTVAVPAGQEQAALLENKGFQRAFASAACPGRCPATCGVRRNSTP